MHFVSSQPQTPPPDHIFRLNKKKGLHGMSDNISEEMWDHDIVTNSAPAAAWL
jgi:hypothetical protein